MYVDTEKIPHLFQVSEVKVKYVVKSEYKPKIVNSRDSFELLKYMFDNETFEMQEEFKILCLNRANEVLFKYEVSKGGISGTVADVRHVASVALNGMASGVILCHNHPSGNDKPSAADIQITKTIKEALAFFEIKLIDHVIVCDLQSKYYSFADEGMI